MTKEFDNTNRGVLFKNDKKQNEKHSDYNGSLNVDGQEFYLNAWLKEGKNGKFFSISIKPKQAKAEGAPAGSDPFEDDVPF